jgi:predicted O-methyltransferase YrrM
MLLNILKQLLNFRRAPVLIKKLAYRFVDSGQHEHDAALSAWLETQACDFSEFAQDLNPDLWAEAKRYAKDARAKADAQLSALPVTLGGGGYTELLYFLTRYLRPETVVETGVAAGHSSRAVLTALARNKETGGIEGHLYSSDFPYFRIDNPEQYIGVLVEDTLKPNWTLEIDGDEKNLPKIAARCGRVGLFHYDSEKRYAGRQAALDLLTPVLDRDSIVVMDDINDNAFFKDYVEREGGAFQVFRFEGKFVGLKGDLHAVAETSIHTLGESRQ